MEAWLERYRGLIIVVTVALAGLGGGLLFFQQSESAAPIEIVLPTATSVPDVKIYVSGAVHQPGVYSLRPEDRVEEAIWAAGGPDEEADLSRINLAQKVRDEQHIHVPELGEEAAVQPASGSPSDTGKVNINTADLSILEGLPNIGPVKAQRIITYREQNGPFKSIEEITNVSGIGPATFDAIKPFLSAY